jgi:hypothetical protein
MTVPNKTLLDSVLFLGFSTQVKEIVDIVHLIMSVLNVLLEALELKVDLETLLSTDETT